MGDLVPEKRLDKNGVLTTKHVRATPTSTPSVAPLPKVDDTAARALRVFNSIRNQRGEVAAAFVVEIQRKLESKRIAHDAMERLILTLNPKTLERLQSSEDLLATSITSCVEIGVIEKSFSRINNLAVLRRDLSDLTDHGAIEVIGGLSAHLSSSVFYDYGNATEEELATPRAVLRAALELDSSFTTTNNFNASKYISSGPLVNLIEERPQDVDRIIAIVNERKPVLDEAGVRGIAELLDSDTHHAVIDGIL